MPFSLLSRSRINQVLRAPRPGKRSKQPTPNRKLRSTLRGIEPLENRQLLSINPNGPEIFVNTAFASGDQDDAAIAIQPLTNNGTTAIPAVNSVVVWESNLEDGSGDTIRARRYNPTSGVALLGIINPTQTTLGDQSNPAVAMRSNGEFVIAWQGQGAADVDGIYFRRFNSGGTALGNETLVNSTTPGAQTNPSIAIDNSDGSFIITWESPDSDGKGISARYFDSAGNPGSQFPVNINAVGEQANPVVAIDGSGFFVIAWESDTAGTGKEIMARKFNNSSGIPGSLTGEMLISEEIAGDQALPSISMDNPGNFVVAWAGPGTGDADGGIYARRYGPENVPVAIETAFLVNSLTVGVQTRPSVELHRPPTTTSQTVLPRGFVVSWQGPEDVGLGDAAFARGYTAAATATPRGPEVVVHTTPRINDQGVPTIGMDSTGAGMITFQSFASGADSAGYGVYARRYTRLNNPPVANIVTINTIFEDSSANVINLFDPLFVTDADGDTLTFSVNGTGGTVVPQNGILQPNTAAGTLASGHLVYTPNVDFFGRDRFTFTASDGVVSNLAVVEINVQPVNDQPSFGRAGIVQAATTANPVTVTAQTGFPHGLTAGQRIFVTGMMIQQTLSSAIANAGTNEIVFTTAGNHGLATGDQLTVVGATGSGAFDPTTGTVNATWTVTVVNATQFRLNGSVFSGGYNSSSGHLERLSPFNGYRNVGTVNVGLNTFQLAGANGTGLGFTYIANTGRWETAPLSGLVTNATNATPIVITSNAHGLSNGQVITVSGVTGNNEANGTFRVQGVATNTFQLFDVATGLAVTGTGIYNGGGQWTAADSNKITGASNANPIVVTSNGHGLSDGDRVTVSNVLVGGVISGFTDTDQNQPGVITSNGHGLQSGQTVTLTNVWKGSNISNVSNAFTAARIDADNNHRMVDGDAVVIAGVPGVNAGINNTALQPEWYVDVIDADEFELYQDPLLLNPVVASGPTSGGTWRAMSVANGLRTVRVLNTNQFQIFDLKEDVAITAVAASGGRFRLTSNGHDIDADANQAQVTVAGILHGGTVAAATNASPIVITSNGHNLQAGDEVIIAGALGNTAANGTWTVGAVTVNTFELVGSDGTASGAYTANSARWIAPNTSRTTNANGTFRTDGIDQNVFQLQDSIVPAGAVGPYLLNPADLVRFGLPGPTWNGLATVQLNEPDDGADFVGSGTVAFHPAPTTWSAPSAANGTWVVDVTGANTFELETSRGNGPFLLNTNAQGVVLGEFRRGVSETFPQGFPSLPVFLGSIVPGPANELGQTLTIDAVSDNPALIPDPTVTYPANGDPTQAMFTVSPNPNPLPGTPRTANITVDIDDGGLVRQETIEIIINNTPTLDSLTSPITVLEDSVGNSVLLTGINEGHVNESGQNLRLRAVTLNPANDQPLQTLINDPLISYLQGSATAVLTFDANANQFGQAKIRVFVEDDSGGTNNAIFRDFLVNIIGIADTPFIQDVITTFDTQSPLIFINRNGNDTQSFRIQNIFGGLLFLANGTTAVTDGQWITQAQGAAGLRFTPFLDSITPGSFEALPSTVVATNPLVETGVAPGVVPAVGHIYITNPQPITTTNGTNSTVNGAGDNFIATATATDADGNYFVVYVGQNDAHSQGQLLMRRYRADGLALTNPIVVDTSTTASFNFDPAIAIDPDGDVVVVWTDDNALGGNLVDISGRRFDALGMPKGNVFRVNGLVSGIVTGNQLDAAVAMDAEGNFVVSWTSQLPAGVGGIFDDDGLSNGVFAQRFDFNQDPMGREFRVASLIPGNQQASSVAMEPDGDFIIAWESIGQGNANPMRGDTNGYSVRAQRYDKAGNRISVRELQTITLATNALAFPTGTAYKLYLGNKSIEVTFFDDTAANYPHNVAALQGALDVLVPGGKVLTSVADDPRFATNMVGNFGTRGLVFRLPEGGGVDHGLYFSASNQADWPLLASQVLGNAGGLGHGTIQPDAGSPTFNNTTQAGNQHASNEVQRITITGGNEGIIGTGGTTVNVTIPGFPVVSVPLSTNPELMAQLLEAGLQQRLPGDITVRQHLGVMDGLTTGSPVQVTSRLHGLVSGDRITFSGVLVGDRITTATNATPIVVTSASNHGMVAGQKVTIEGVKGNTAANGTFFVQLTGNNATFALYHDAALTQPVAGNGAPVGNTGRWGKESTVNKLWQVNVFDANVFELFDPVTGNAANGLGGNTWWNRSGTWTLTTTTTGVRKVQYNIGFSGTVGVMNVPNITATLTNGGAGSAIARTDVRVGTPSELVINNVTGGDQRNPSVAVDPNGNFAVAFENPGTDTEIAARLFNSAGVVTQTTPTNNNRDQFQVNTSTAGKQSTPTVTMTPNGSFVVTWWDQPDPFASISARLKARPYDAVGRAGNVVELIPVDAYHPLPGIGVDAPYGISTDDSGRVNISMIEFSGALSSVRTRSVPLDLPSTVTLFNRTDAISNVTPLFEDPSDPLLQTRALISSNNHRLANGDVITVSGILITDPGLGDILSATINGQFAVVVEDADNFSLVNPATGDAIILDGPYAGGGRWSLVPVTSASPIVMTQTNHGLQTGDQVIVTGVRVGAQITGASGILVTPIRIISPSHGLVTGDTITVSGVQGNVAANGNNRVVTVIDANTFELNGTVGNGTYVANTGQWTRNSTTANANGRFIVTVIDNDRFSLNGSTGNQNVSLAFLPYIGGAYTTVISDLISGATNATPIVVTATNHGLSNGDTVTITGAAGNLAANGTFLVGGVTIDTFELFDPASGDPVAGTGNYTSGGRWTEPIETAPPTVAGVFLARELAGLTPSLRVDRQPVLEGERLRRGVTRLVVSFSEGLVGSTVTDPANWELFRNAVVGGPLTLDVSHFISLGDITFGFDAVTGRYEAVITFSQVLPQGDYLLRANDVITDVVGNVLDGDRNGIAGANFERRFSTLGSLRDPSGEVTGATNASPIVITSADHGLAAGQLITVSEVLGNTAANGAHTVSLITGVITGAAGNPIAITSTGHGLTTGERVLIAGVGGNDNANGAHAITVVDADTFTLNGVDSSGAYTFGGSWTSLDRFALVGTTGDGNYTGGGVWLGDETIANEFLNGDQINPSIARDAQGNYVVVWQTSSLGLDNSGFGIVGRRYLADGTPIGDSEQQRITFNGTPSNDASTFTLKFGDMPAIQVVYSSVANTMAQRVRTALNSLEVPATVSAVLVSGRPQVTITFGGPGVDLPQIIATPTTTVPPFTMTVDTITQGGARSEFLINNVTVGEQVNPRVSMADNGIFVVIWEGSGTGDPNTGIFGRRFNFNARTVPVAPPAGFVLTPALAVQFLVNNITDNVQDQASVDMAADGSFVVTWRSDPDGTPNGANEDIFGGSIQMRRYNAAGTAQGNQVLVNGHIINVPPNTMFGTFGEQADPDVVIGDDGTIMVVWETPDFKAPITGVLPGGGPNDPIMITSARHGLTVGQTIEITGVGGVPEANGTHTVVALHPTNPLNQFFISALGGSGSYVGGGEWTVPGTGTGIFQRRYTSAGAAIAIPERVNTTTAGEQTNPVVEGDNAGRFIVAWNSFGQDGDNEGIYAQVYRPDGAGNLGGLRVGAANEIQRLNFTGTDPQENAPFRLTLPGVVTANITYSRTASVTATRIREAFEAIGVAVQVAPDTSFPAAEQNKHYLITFLNEGVDITGTIGVQLLAGNVQVVQNGDTTGGYEILVNQTTAGAQTNPRAAMDLDGDIVFAWESGGDVLARRFSILGAPQGNEFVVNTVTTGAQAAPSVAVNANGRLLVAWQGPFSGGALNEILVQRFVADTEPPALPSGDAGGPYAVAEGSAAGIPLTATATTGLIYTWDLDGDAIFGETGAAATHGDETGLTPTFIPNGLDGTAAGLSYVVTFRVDDGIGGIINDSATVTVTNVAPTATSAGGPYTVDEGGTTPLAGSATDPFATETLLYDWDFNNDGDFIDPGETNAGATPNFSALNLDGPATLTVGMRVRDDDGGISATLTATVNVINVNPTAITGGPYTVPEGSSSIQLDGSATDPAGTLDDPMVFDWDLNNDGDFDDAGEMDAGPTPTVSVVGLDGPTTLTVRLRVTDDDGGVSAVVTTTIDVTNVAPNNVDPQGPYIVNEGQSINLTAANATDIPADIPGLVYEWDYSGNPMPFTVSATGQTVPFLAPLVTATEVLTIYLRVLDNDGGVSLEASTTITINDLPAPTAFADGPYTVVEGQTVVLDRAYATPPGTYNYLWDFDLDGAFGEIGTIYGDETGLAPTFDASGLLAGASIPVTFRVNDGVNPPADSATTVNVIAAVAPQIIDNSDPPSANGTFATTGNWAAGGGSGVGRNNNVLVAFGESFQPTDTAIWTFNLAGPGRYRVASTWFTNPAFDHLFTDVARFEIADGTGAVLGTSIINMKVFPNDFTDAGSAWENMGAFEVTGPTLQVRLFTSQDDATYVVADAIRIEKIADLPAASEIQVTMNGENGVNIPDNTGVASFGTTDYGDAVTQTFTISNQGTAPLTIGPGTVTATPNTIFTVISQPALLLLNPGQSTTFQVRMDAGTVGAQSATVSFANSEGNENPYDFLVSGTVLATNIIDNGDPEYDATPPASFGFSSVQGRAGVNGDTDYAYTRDIQPGVGPGNDAATWTFNVAPGQYRVSTTYVFNGGFDGSAPFTVFEGPAVVGGDVRGSRVIDQRVAPDDFVFDGSNWEEIGVVNIVSGTTMTVQLLGDDPNFFVIADAILIERIGDIPVGPELVVYVDDQEATAATVNYGSVQLNHPVEKTFHIANAGTTVLDITSAVTVPVGYELVSSPTLTSINPGQVSDFVVRLKAEFEGTDPPVTPDPITFSSNDTDEGTVDVTATGTVLNYRIIDDQNFADGYSVTAGAGTGPDPGAFGLDVSFAHGPTAAPPVVATYTFDNLTPGNYLVLATWPDRGGNGIYSSNTTITVMDGAVVEGTFVVDQQEEPTFNFAGDVWNVLTAGFLSITDTVTVTITTAGADGFVLFDAILLARGGPPAPPGNSEFGEGTGTSSLLVAPSSGGGLRTEQEESDALDQALLGTTYWDDELEDVATLLAADSSREDSNDDVTTSRIGDLQEDELEMELADWLE